MILLVNQLLLRVLFSVCFFFLKVKETVYVVWSFKIEYSPEHKIQFALHVTDFDTQVFPSNPLMKSNHFYFVTCLNLFNKLFRGSSHGYFFRRFLFPYHEVTV